MENKSENPTLSYFSGPPIPEVPLPANKSYVEIILDKLVANEDRVIYTEIPSKRQVTAGELRKASIGLASVLSKDFGYLKGDVACICSYNMPEFVTAIFGSAASGMTLMLCNALYSYYEMNHQIVDSNTKLVFIPGDKILIEKALKACEGTNVNRLILLTSPEYSEQIEVAKSQNPNIKFSFLQELLDQQKNDSNVGLPKIDWDFGNDTALIPYSSGTTGKAKGVVLKHSTMREHMRTFIIFSQMMETYGIKATTDFCIPPMFHIYGFMVCGILAPFMGCHALMQRRFNFTQMLESIQEFKANRVFMLPAVMVQLAKDPLVDNYDLTSIKSILCGTAPMPKEQLMTLLSKINKEHPPLFTNAYGMTESGGATMPPDAPTEYVLSGSVGQISMGTDGKIVDLETLETVPIGCEGEIWLRSPTRMHGYLNREEETRQTLMDDGWVRTGDIGYFNQQGYLWITDRLKELVKYKGYQVPPAELEDLLLTHPSILEAAVVGKPDENAGELPTAFVVLSKDAHTTQEEIQAYVKERAAPYKQLKGGVIFMQSLPRNPTGKLLRRKLKEMIPK